MAEKNFEAKKGLTVANTVIVTSGANVGIGTDTPTVRLHISANDAIMVPVGNTGQRPTGANGHFRYNSETGQFEGYATGSWGQIGGGGGGYYKGNNGAIGSANGIHDLFRLTANTQTANISIATGENSMIVGPFTVATGATLSIAAGCRVVIL